MPISTRMHPIRWAKTRPFARSFIDRARRLGPVGQVTMSVMQQSFNEMLPTYNSAIMKLPFEKRPPNARIMEKEVSLGLVAARFYTMGRNLFQLSPGLAQALEHTSLSGVRVNDILLPHKLFYVSLDGIDCGGLPGSENVIDGAYVDATMPQGVQIYVTTRRVDTNPNSSKRWPLNRDPYFYVPCEFPDDDNPTFEQVIERAVASGEINVADDAMEPDEEDIGEEIIGPDGHPIPGVRSVSRRNNLLEGIANREALPNVKRALSIVINSLAWLTAEPQDAIAARAAWPDDAPREMVEDVLQARSKGARQRAEAALLQRGFTRIRILGSGIEAIPDIPRGDAGEGHELTKAHWRIGHYRRQPYGAGRSERKLIWIRPVLVRPDLELDPDSGGHHYVIGP